ncbi:MAG: hypothetical protein IEMM0002_0445 [bacterium]|nr:MAG: hypothetical protein IEMM0002_0445 [bacterium]
MFSNTYRVFLFCLLGLFVSCAGNKIERAFSSRAEPRESNKVISQYCGACHVHKDFEPAAHIETLGTSSSGSVNLSSAECRGCHTYKKTWLLDVRRGTYRPANK